MIDKHHTKMESVFFFYQYYLSSFIQSSQYIAVKSFENPAYVFTTQDTLKYWAITFYNISYCSTMLFLP